MNKNNDEIEIDLFKLVKTLWKKALVIILIAVIMATATFAVTLLFITPQYKATASLYVNNSSFSFGASSFSISSSDILSVNMGGRCLWSPTRITVLP